MLLSTCKRVIKSQEITELCISGNGGEANLQSSPGWGPQSFARAGTSGGLSVGWPLHTSSRSSGPGKYGLKVDRIKEGFKEME